jgi:hypothetical protein
MQFTQRLRDRVRAGEITCSVRIWTQPHVKIGGRYALPPGGVVVDSLLEIELADITPQLARRSGFKGVVDLLKVAKHGRGSRIFLVEFHYEEPQAANPATRSARAPARAASSRRRLAPRSRPPR